MYGPLTLMSSRLRSRILPNPRRKPTRLARHWGDIPDARPHPICRAGRGASRTQMSTHLMAYPRRRSRSLCPLTFCVVRWPFLRHPRPAQPSNLPWTPRACVGRFRLGGGSSAALFAESGGPDSQ